MAGWPSFQVRSRLKPSLPYSRRLAARSIRNVHAELAAARRALEQRAERPAFQAEEMCKAAVLDAVGVI